MYTWMGSGVLGQGTPRGHLYETPKVGSIKY